MASSKATVLVTGASGFLGSHCVKQLLEAGYQVRGTVRSLSNELKVKPIKDLDKEGRLELVEADLLKPDGWDKAADGCQSVLHVASPFPAIGSADASTIKAAIDGTLNVLRAAAASSTVDRVVLTSSTAAIAGKVYGECPDFRTRVDSKVFTEDDWTDDTLPKVDAYVRSKVLAERAAWEFVKENTGRTFGLVVINPSFIIGPLLHSTECTSAKIIKQLLQTKLPFMADVWMPCCDVRDVARAHLTALTTSGAVNRRHLIAQQPSYNLLQMSRDLAAEFGPMGYKVPTRKAPYVLLWLGSWFDKQISQTLPNVGREVKMDNSRMRQVLGIQSPIDQKTSVIDMAYSLIDNGLIRQTPGYKPRAQL